VTVGFVSIIASSGSYSASTTLTVTPAQLLSIQINPVDSQINLSTSQQFTANGTYSDSTIQNITSDVTWTSSDTSGAIISNITGSKGLVTTIDRGVTVITAGKDGITKSTTLTVLALPDAPAGICSSPGLSKVSLEWSEVSGATSYNLYWSTSPSLSKTVYEGVISGITSTTYIHSNLTKNKTYNYGVTAVNGDGEGAISNIAASILDIILVNNLQSIGEIAADATDLYFVWSYAGDGRLEKVSKNGGSVTTLVTGLKSPTTLAIDDTHVFFKDCGTNNCTGGADPIWPSIKKVPKAGGPVEIVAGGLSLPNDITLDSLNVYFTEESPPVVKKVSKSGGSITTLATGASNAYGAIEVDNTDVYFLESGAGTGNLYKVSTSGGATTNLASLLFIVRNRIALDSTYVYFTERGTNDTTDKGKTRKIAKSGGIVATLTAELYDPVPIVLDSSNVYASECGEGNSCSGLSNIPYLQKVPISGGAPIALSETSKAPYPGNIGLAMDSNSIYYVSPGNGGLNGAIISKGKRVCY
jgi:hypothetical protein